MRAPYIKDIISVLVQGLRNGDFNNSIPSALAFLNLPEAERAPHMREIMYVLITKGLKSVYLYYSIPTAQALFSLSETERAPYIEEIKKADLNNILKKSFYNIEFEGKI